MHAVRFVAMTLSVTMPAVVVVTAQAIPPALAEMADTERAFAQRARETTVRQAFIDFFADEAVGFEPDPVPARESLRRQTRPQPPGFQLLWEPRLGDVAASGDLGYLTGPAEYLNPGRPTTYSTYFSIWKRQPDGTFRVIIDVGASAPSKPPFAPGFTRAAAGPAYRGPAAGAEASLRAADEALAAGLRDRGPAALVAVMPESARVHREGRLPMSRDDAAAWFSREVTAMTSEPMKVETSAAGDLGYTWGRYSATVNGQATAGYYIRAWTRAADGSWRLVADVVTPPPPPPR